MNHYDYLVPTEISEEGSRLRMLIANCLKVVALSEAEKGQRGHIVYREDLEHAIRQLSAKTVQELFELTECDTGVESLRRVSINYDDVPVICAYKRYIVNGAIEKVCQTIHEPQIADLHSAIEENIRTFDPAHIDSIVAISTEALV